MSSINKHCCRIGIWCFPAMIVFVLLSPCLVRALEVRSPDGHLMISFTLGEDKGGVKGVPFWELSYRGRTILESSRLGLTLKDAPGLDRNFTLGEVNRSTGDHTWQPVWGERRDIRDHYNELTVDLQDNQTLPRRLRLHLRAYNEGAALSYTFPVQPGLTEMVITAEHTRFRFAGDYPAWAVYSAQGRYSKVPLSKIKANCERPLTVKLADDLYAAVGEAALVDFARMRLQPVKNQPHTLESMLAGEVEVKTPYTTPWRFVLIGETPGQLLERNFLPLNLNPPCALENTSWIKPGNVIREVTLTTAGGKACVDFAVERGLQYVEFDAGWYGPEGSDQADATTVELDPKRSKGPLDLPEVIRYANQHNIGILLYVNRRALERQLDDILPLFEEWGVKGVKYGFVQVGSQKWTTWLHDAVRKAAAHRLMVDIHDEYRPTGFSRTYPNLMTQEGIGGNETMPPAEQNLIYPFTRSLCGPADYTFCWYTSRNKNTRAHQLAASVVYFSPWQFLFWYDRPGQYQGESELDFWKYLPTSWDEIRVIQGEIGEYITVARRRGRHWYIGTLNAIRRRTLQIPLSFLDPDWQYIARIHSDGDPAGGTKTQVRIESVPVDRTITLKADLAANGGQAIQITPFSRKSE